MYYIQHFLFENILYWRRWRRRQGPAAANMLSEGQKRGDRKLYTLQLTQFLRFSLNTAIHNRKVALLEETLNLNVRQPDVQAKAWNPPRVLGQQR